MEATPAMLDAVVADVLARTLAAGNLTMNLSQSDFNPASLSGFTEADFDGYAAKSFTTTVNGVDVATGMRTLTMAPPAGGFRFVAGANISGPQQIYGFCIYNADDAMYVGGEKFAEPLTISTAGQQLNVGLAQLTLKNDAM